MLFRKALRSIVVNLIYLWPFSPWRGLVYYQLDKDMESFLDVGCEVGGTSRNLRIHRITNVYSVGVDLFLPYLKECKKDKLYDELVLASATHLPFRYKTFDTVFLIEIIEHLGKKYALHLIGEAEKIARKQVIISTPTGCRKGFRITHSYQEYILQQHRSCWTFLELKKLGYKVRGDFGPSFLPDRLAYLLSFVVPLTYFFPSVASHIMATKRIR
jgi:SAM-dependent methyltransferase